MTYYITTTNGKALVHAAQRAGLTARVKGNRAVVVQDDDDTRTGTQSVITAHGSVHHTDHDPIDVAAKAWL